MMQSHVPAPSKSAGINEAVIALFTVATIVIAAVLSMQMGFAVA